MTRQYLRKLSVILANNDTALDISALRVVFKIKQWDLQTPNNAVITAYNMSRETQDRIQREFSRVILQAGYEGGRFGTIFEGTLVQSFAGRENATDTFFTMVASDGDQGLNFGVVSTSIAAGSTHADATRAAIAAMAPHGVSEGYMAPEVSAGHPLPRGRVLFGMASDHLRNIARNTDTNFSIQNGKAQFLPKEGYLPGPAVVLTAATGLIGLPIRTQDGITLRCLLNPEIKVGSPIQLDNRSVQQLPASTSQAGVLASLNLQASVRFSEDGFYRILAIDHVGDSRGNDWYSDIIAISLRDPAPKPQVDKGRL